ncbi:hypothetical protein BDN72DRAFT_898909 [Pluteus cervinus]|uniref:Uncharacterized protein n=1 Tax=Pluteus cervinus TaxID=181527 RepID=A0ACD3APR5_9AGAR|nr:hypothetical protein BDN72DRAFT_898909 [Pluteus cervinus]
MSLPSQTTSQNDISSAAVARKAIDEEIAQLEARIISLKTLRNTLSPTSSLPPEIIQEVFITASQQMAIPWGKFGRTSLKITWVCRRWRELAHQTSALWSYVDFINPAWIEAVLSLTQSRPLDFNISIQAKHNKYHDAALSICLRNLPRFKKLAITSNEDHRTHSSPLWANSAPLLEDLRLIETSLPASLFSGIFPVLHTLHLYSCGFDWESLPIHSGMKELRIFSPFLRTSANDMTKIIQDKCPGLEALSLDNTLLPLTTHPMPHHPTVPSRMGLTKIKSLSINEDHAPSVTFILDHLSLSPHPDRILMEVKGGPEQLDTIRSLVSCQGAKSWPVISLEIDIMSNHLGIYVQIDWSMGTRNAQMDMFDDGGIGENRHGDLGPISKPPPSRIFLVIELFADLSNLIPMFDILPLSSFNTLSLTGGDFNDHGPALTDYFGPKGIERMRIHVFFLPTFTAAIQQQVQRLRDIIGHDQEIKEEDLGDEMKAQLRDVLTFHRLRLLRYDGEFDVVDDDLSSDQNYTILREWLMWRKVIGFGLKDLIFVDLVIPDELKQLFEGVVDRLLCIEREELTSMGLVNDF